MRRLFSVRITRPRLAAVLVIAIAAGHASAGWAIEMFTFFGDGSRVGLPSLEVPVEAYPGIPLRSDRIRARRRGQRAAPSARAGAAAAGTITLRTVPAAAVAPAPAAVPIAPEPPSRTAE